jgi:hypothetical protein
MAKTLELEAETATCQYPNLENPKRICGENLLSAEAVFYQHKEGKDVYMCPRCYHHYVLASGPNDME